MFTIRKNQMAVLAAYMRKRFEDGVVRHISGSFPVQFNKLVPPSSTDEPVRAVVREGIRRAAGYQITSERDVKRFIELLIGLGSDFDTRADAGWAQSILRDKTLSGHARMELIHQQLPARLGNGWRAPH
jgi:hypothetical protein